MDQHLMTIHSIGSMKRLHRVEYQFRRTALRRGDVLQIPRNQYATAFWLVAEAHVGDSSAGAVLVPRQKPPAPEYSAIRAIAPLSSSMLYVSRRNRSTPPSKYVVYNRENNWARGGLSERWISVA